MRRTLKIATLVSLLTVFAVDLTAQKQSKSWKEWTKKEAEKILHDSPWSHVQVETNTAEMFYQPTADPAQGGGRTANAGSRLENGATNQETNVTYGIRFFSARPVRQAFIRMIQLQQKVDPEALARMNNYAEALSPDSIIVAVTTESTDKRSLGKVMQIISSAATGTLKNTTYLERNDGKRLFLEEYVPPGSDGFGARFIFPRNVDGQPFVDQDSGELRFVSEFASTVKLNMRFKLSDMMLDGKLEF